MSNEHQFPGEHLSQQADLPTSHQNALKESFAMFLSIQPPIEGEADLYHSPEDHIFPLVETALAISPGIKQLNQVGRDKVIAAVQYFRRQLTPNTTVPDSIPSPIDETIDFKADSGAEQSKSEITNDDILLTAIALLFHDVGRHEFEGKDLSSSTRKKAGHELRSSQTLLQLISNNSNLATTYPHLFNSEAIDQTKMKLHYLIMNTVYTGNDISSSGELTESAGRLSQISSEEQDKYRFLGSLVMALDIGTMQIKQGNIRDLAGLVNEYLADVDVSPDTPLYTSLEKWVLNWPLDVATMASDIYSLIRYSKLSPNIITGGNQLTHLDPALITDNSKAPEPNSPQANFAKTLKFRKLFIRFAKKQPGISNRVNSLVDDDKNKRITWGELHKLMTNFYTRCCRLSTSDKRVS